VSGAGELRRRLVAPRARLARLEGQAIDRGAGLIQGGAGPLLALDQRRAPGLERRDPLRRGARAIREREQIMLPLGLERGEQGADLLLALLDERRGRGPLRVRREASAVRRRALLAAGQRVGARPRRPIPRLRQDP